MKFLLILLPLIATVVTQRSPYAGSRPIGQPALAPRFRTEQDNNAGDSVVNRVAEGNTDATTTTQRLPIDARGDEQLVNMLNQWPREHRPFWLLNADAIEQHRNQQPNANIATRISGSETIPAKPSVQRSPFAGSSRI